MEHILIDCDAPGRKQIWRLTTELLRKAGIVLPEITLGVVLGAAAVKLGDNIVSRPSAAANRLFKLVRMLESAHLIWALWELCGGQDGVRTLWSEYTGGVLVGSQRPAVGVGGG